MHSPTEFASFGVWSCAILGEDSAFPSMRRAPIGLVEDVATINCRIRRCVHYTVLVNVNRRLAWEGLTVQRNGVVVRIRV
jgi:hypothetical protein